MGEAVQRGEPRRVKKLRTCGAKAQTGGVFDNPAGNLFRH
uniref:Uncharacterized protein n=1 Tax=Peronospora matthiolae TaxID=2874970 RepID=A0AAV1TKL6_9STRA